MVETSGAITTGDIPTIDVGPWRKCLADGSYMENCV